MKLNLTGAAYKHPDISVNYQRCLNMYPTFPGPSGRNLVGMINPKSDEKGAVLLPTAGKSLLINLDSDHEVRSFATFGDFTYAVVGDTVYKLTINYATQTATSSSLGTLDTTEGEVNVAANPTQIMWVDGSSEGYIYTPDADTFERITDSDSEFPGGTSVVFLDSYFIVNDPDTGNFYVSAQNNGLSWDPLNVATAESVPDNIIAFGISKGELWVFGARSTEIWYDAANIAGSPFSPRTGLGLQIGCGASRSVVSLNDTLIWMDDRGYIVQSAISPLMRSNNSGYDLNIISDDAITNEILGYVNRSDAIAMGYNYRGHLMYQITFPSAKKTWVYDYTTKAWHERAYYNPYTEALEHDLGQFYAQSGSLHLMGGVRDGKIYLSSPELYTDADIQIRRIRTTPVHYDGDDFLHFDISKLELRMGIGSTSTVTAPEVGMRYSHDGGHTWSNRMARDMGAVGEYNKSITWNRLGSGNEWIFEFQIAEDMPFSIIEGVISIGNIED